MRTAFPLLALALSLAAFNGPAGAASAKEKPGTTYNVRTVLVAPYSGVITPTSAEFLTAAIARVNGPGGADLLVIALDTPGGLDVSMREIIQAMLASKKPVAVYVSPQGARAASAGVFIAMASPLVAMAPGTNIGAAHPVMLGALPFGAGDKKAGKAEPAKDPSAEKALNDAAAYIQSIAQKTGRNSAWAIKAVTQSNSIPAQEAVKTGVADFMAANLDEFLARADGFRAGDFGTLRAARPAVEYFEQTRRQKLLAVITNPDVAMILMSLGAAGLFIELYNPGLILPGVVGAVSLVTAFYAFQTMSASTAGIALILLGFVFFIAEIKVLSYGLLTLAGALSILFGALLLFEPQPLGALSVSMHMLFSTIIGLVAVVAALAYIVLRAQLRQVVTGIETLAGKNGLAKTALSPKGTVLVEGELWQAESVSGDLPAGAAVTVTAVEGFKIKIRRAD
ncbi:MAG TPA: nodulation protein NfeD [Elusimicrobiales bacterium]|mgnify:CR=1 FL=1|nr:nodulation protein NfeD [Elusimicrobiales bacterium]